jgi:hypothetical protein
MLLFPYQQSFVLNKTGRMVKNNDGNFGNEKSFHSFGADF